MTLCLLGGPYEFGTTPWMSVSAAKRFSDGMKEKKADSEMHTVLTHAENISGATATSWQIHLQCKRQSVTERWCFLASLIDNVFQLLVTATILEVVHAELCHTWPSTLRLFTERKTTQVVSNVEISNMAWWSFNLLLPCYNHCHG